MTQKPDAANVRIFTPEQVPALLASLATSFRGTCVRHPEDVVSLDGNHYTFNGDCEGCVRLRSRIGRLEDAVSELQDLLADAATVMKNAGMIEEGEPSA